MLFTKLGLYQLHVDYSIFVILQVLYRPIITTFVNNLNIFALAKSGIIKQIKEKLALTFKMVDISLLVFYIGLKVICNQKKKIIKLLQPVYIKKFLYQYGMLKVKIAKTLI